MRRFLRGLVTGAGVACGVVIGGAVGYFVVFDLPALVVGPIVEKLSEGSMVGSDDRLDDSGLHGGAVGGDG